MGHANHIFQLLDTVGGCRVRREEAVASMGVQGVDDKHVGRRRVLFGRVIVNPGGPMLDPLEGRGEPERASANFCPHRVRPVFPCAADRHLYKTCGHGRQDHERETANDAAIAVTVPAKEESKIGEHGQGTGKCGGHCHDERIAVLDMGVRGP